MEDNQSYTKSYNCIRNSIVEKYGTKGWSYYGVYVTLLSHRNHNDTFSWPNEDTIAEETKFKRRYIIYAIQALEADDYLGIISFKAQSGTKNKYYFPQEPFFNEIEFTEAGGKHRTHAKPTGISIAPVTAEDEEQELKDFNY